MGIPPPFLILQRFLTTGKVHFRFCRNFSYAQVKTQKARQQLLNIFSKYTIYMMMDWFVRLPGRIGSMHILKKCDKGGA